MTFAMHEDRGRLELAFGDGRVAVCSDWLEELGPIAWLEAGLGTHTATYDGFTLTRRASVRAEGSIVRVEVAYEGQGGRDRELTLVVTHTMSARYCDARVYASAPAGLTFHRFGAASAKSRLQFVGGTRQVSLVSEVLTMRVEGTAEAESLECWRGLKLRTAARALVRAGEAQTVARVALTFTIACEDDERRVA